MGNGRYLTIQKMINGPELFIPVGFNKLHQVIGTF